MGLKPTYNPTGLQWGCIEFCPHNNQDTYSPDSISANSLVSLYKFEHASDAFPHLSGDQAVERVRKVLQAELGRTFFSGDPTHRFFFGPPNNKKKTWEYRHFTRMFMGK